MNESTIHVVGTGSIHVVPDVIRLETTISRVFKSYAEAYTCAKENSDWMVKILEYNHLSGKQAKTIRLDISDNMVNSYDEDGDYIGKEKSGFLLDQRIKIDVGIDNVLVNNIVRGIGKFIDGAQINIGYTQRDPRPTQLKMLERAVKDAEEKARIMASSLGCELDGVANIDYGYSHLSVYSQARAIHDNAEAKASTAGGLDITPDDLVVSDNVNVTWYLSLNSNYKCNTE